MTLAMQAFLVGAALVLALWVALCPYADDEGEGEFEAAQMMRGWKP